MGFEAATVRDIIRRTSLSVGAFYNYYRSKEEVFDALADDGARRFRPILHAQAAKATRLRILSARRGEGLFRLPGRGARPMAGARPCPGQVPHARNTPEMLAVFEEVRQVFADVMDRGLAPKVDLDYLAASCIAVAREIGDRCWCARRPIVRSAVEFVVQLILGGLPALPRAMTA